MSEACKQIINGENGSLAVNRLLVPYTLAAWLGFLAIGIPLPVLSLFAHDHLRYDPLVVGIVVGAHRLPRL